MSTIRLEGPLGDGISAIYYQINVGTYFLCCLQETKATNRSYCSQRTANQSSKHFHVGNEERMVGWFAVVCLLLFRHTFFLISPTSLKNYKILKNCYLLIPKSFRRASWKLRQVLLVYIGGGRGIWDLPCSWLSSKSETLILWNHASMLLKEPFSCRHWNFRSSHNQVWPKR